MVDKYDVFITIDNNMEYQHQLEGKAITFIVLSAKNNKFETLSPLMQQVNNVLEDIQKGQVIKIKD